MKARLILDLPLTIATVLGACFLEEGLGVCSLELFEWIVDMEELRPSASDEVPKSSIRPESRELNEPNNSLL